MNRSRIKRLEKRVMPEREVGPKYLIIHKFFREGVYYHKDGPEGLFHSRDEAIEAWESQHGTLPRGCKIVVIIDFRDAPKLEETSQDG